MNQTGIIDIFFSTIFFSDGSEAKRLTFQSSTQIIALSHALQWIEKETSGAGVDPYCFDRIVITRQRVAIGAREAEMTPIMNVYLWPDIFQKKGGES